MIFPFVQLLHMSRSCPWLSLFFPCLLFHFLFITFLCSQFTFSISYITTGYIFFLLTIFFIFHCRCFLPFFRKYVIKLWTGQVPLIEWKVSQKEKSVVFRVPYCPFGHSGVIFYMIFCKGGSWSMQGLGLAKKEPNGTRVKEIKVI